MFGVAKYSGTPSTLKVAKRELKIKLCFFRESTWAIHNKGYLAIIERKEHLPYESVYKLVAYPIFHFINYPKDGINRKIVKVIRIRKEETNAKPKHNNQQ